MPELAVSVAIDGGGSLDVPGDGVKVQSVTRPGKTKRRARATSPHTHRSIQTHSTLEDDSIAVTLLVEAVSAAALEAKRADLDEAFDQFRFVLTVTEDGVALTYNCNDADSKWNDHDEGMAQRRLAEVTYTMPLEP